MDYQTLSFDEEGLTAMIRLLASPEKASDVLRLGTELSECFRHFRQNHEARVLVVVDSLGAFCIGKLLVEIWSQVAESFSIAETLAEVERPVVAGITGDAIGLGLELALACDIRIAANASHFGFPHIKKGLIPWDGGTQRLSRVIGQAKAMEMILTGEMIDADEARRIGLVSKVVPRDAVMTTTMEIAQTMASKGPIALRYAKEAILKGMDLTLEQGLRLEADLYFLLHTTKDRTEGIKAFREKRTPEFEGR